MPSDHANRVSTISRVYEYMTDSLSSKFGSLIIIIYILWCEQVLKASICCMSRWLIASVHLFVLHCPLLPHPTTMASWELRRILKTDLEVCLSVQHAGANLNWHAAALYLT